MARLLLARLSPSLAPPSMLSSPHPPRPLASGVSKLNRCVIISLCAHAAVDGKFLRNKSAQVSRRDAAGASSACPRPVCHAVSRASLSSKQACPEKRASHMLAYRCQRASKHSRCKHANPACRSSVPIQACRFKRADLSVPIQACRCKRVNARGRLDMPAQRMPARWMPARWMPALDVSSI